MARYEVFGRKDSGEPMQHLGKVDAPNAQLALTEARQCFARRGEVDEMWLVAATEVQRYRRGTAAGLDHSYREIQSYADIGRRRRLVEANVPPTELSDDESLSSSGPDIPT